MKRLLISLLTLTLLLAGCGGGKAIETVVPGDAAKAILSGVTFRDTLVEATGDVVKNWYSFDDKVKDFAVYIGGSGATAEEIAVIRTSDVKTAKATVEKRIEDLKFNFENYVPAEMTKLNDPVVVTRGDVVFMVLCDDTAEAQKAIDGLFAANAK